MLGYSKMEEMINTDTFIKTNMPLADTSIHKVIIAIKQNNIDYLENLLSKSSSPDSDIYQQWLTFEQVSELTKNDDAVKHVESWLESNEISIISKSHNSFYIEAEASVAKWSAILNTTFYVWEDRQSYGKTKLTEYDKLGYHVRSMDYSLPVHLLPHIAAIFNVCDPIPKMRNPVAASKDHTERTSFRSRRKLASTNNGNTVTVPFLKTYYYAQATYNYSATAASKLFQEIFMTDTSSKQYFSPNDLSTFQARYNLVKQPALINDATHATNSCANGNCNEGNLDLQYIMGMAQGVPTMYYHQPNSVGNVFVQWILTVSSQNPVPTVNSISWESDETQLFPSTITSFNTEALKLGVMGVTILVASGDDGANSESSSNTCTCLLAPSFPATSPYVTAVGATMGSSNVVPNLGESEIACQSQQGGVITTGGGFSSYSSAPSWQVSAISKYYNGVNPPNKRGYPDVSLLGTSYAVVVNGQVLSIYGTSASTPAFAGMISSINTLRRQKGLTTVGFINPTLYSSNALGQFNDIQSGNNKCCRYTGIVAGNAPCCPTGFSGAPGWDPVTGLGSIYFPRLANMFNLSIPLTLIDYSSSSSIQLSTTDIIMISVLGSAFVIFCLACCYRGMGRWKQRRETDSTAAAPSWRRRSNERPSVMVLGENQSFSNPNHVYATDEERIIAQQEMIMQQNKNRSLAASAPVIASDIDYSDPSYISLWDTEFKVLADMGFTDEKAILPLLNKYVKVPASQKPNSNGVPSHSRMQQVINELVSQT